MSQALHQQCCTEPGEGDSPLILALGTDYVCAYGTRSDALTVSLSRYTISFSSTSTELRKSLADIIIAEFNVLLGMLGYVYICSRVDPCPNFSC